MTNGAPTFPCQPGNQVRGVSSNIEGVYRRSTIMYVEDVRKLGNVFKSRKTGTYPTERITILASKTKMIADPALPDVDISKISVLLLALQWHYRTTPCSDSIITATIAFRNIKVGVFVVLLNRRNKYKYIKEEGIPNFEARP